MNLTWFKFLGLSGIAGLVIVFLSIDTRQGSPHLRHGLQVFIDPDTGAFQRPARIPEPARRGIAAIAMAKNLFDSNHHRETPSARDRGGYQVHLEHYYRPPRQVKRHPGS